MKPFASCLVLIQLLALSSLLGQPGPQGSFEPLSPRQRMMNGTRTALVKDHFYMGIPILGPIEQEPDWCDMLLKSGASFPEWDEGMIGRTIGRGVWAEFNLPFGERSLSLNPSIPGGKIRITGINEAWWDINRDDIQQNDEPILERMDESRVRMSELGLLASLLGPGCLDFDFWDGFEIDNPNRVDFCLIDFVNSEINQETHVFRSVRRGIVPLIVNMDVGGTGLTTQITLTNTGYEEISGFLEFFDAVIGFPTFPHSRDFDLGPLSSLILNLPPLEAFRLLATVYSNDPLTNLVISTLFLARVVEAGSQGEAEPSGAAGPLLGAAGLASPPLAGEQTLAVNRNSAGVNTGVLIANPHNQDGMLWLTLLDGDDEVVAEANLALSAKTSESKFFLEYFGLESDGAFADFQGTLRISGDVPTSVVTLGTEGGFQQYSLPAGGGVIGQ